MIRTHTFFATLLVPLVALFWTGPVAADEEPELVIVKYGKVLVKSPVLGAKVFVDGEYRGRADSIVDDVVAGEHEITCTAEGLSVAGRFTISKHEVLKLEARFQEGRLVHYVEKGDKAVAPEVKVAQKLEPKPEPKPEPKQEAEQKAAAPLEAKSEPVTSDADEKKAEKVKKVEAPKPPEKSKKQVAEEKKKDEKKAAGDERRELHLNIMRITFDDIDSQDIRIGHKASPKVITRYTEKKGVVGTYYKTKKGILLCDAGPCEQQWTTAFQYTDESGKNDSFSVTWKQTVFNGMTPSGTSKRDLVVCLNKDCQNFTDGGANTVVDVTADRYRMKWTKSQLVIRRADILKEVLDSGASPDSY